MRLFVGIIVSLHFRRTERNQSSSSARELTRCTAIWVSARMSDMAVIYCSVKCVCICVSAHRYVLITIIITLPSLAQSLSVINIASAVSALNHEVNAACAMPYEK